MKGGGELLRHRPQPAGAGLLCAQPVAVFQRPNGSVVGGVTLPPQMKATMRGPDGTCLPSDMTMPRGPRAGFVSFGSLTLCMSSSLCCNRPTRA